MENYIFFHRTGQCRKAKADPSRPETWPFAKDEIREVHQDCTELFLKRAVIPRLTRDPLRNKESGNQVVIMCSLCKVIQVVLSIIRWKSGWFLTFQWRILAPKTMEAELPLSGSVLFLSRRKRNKKISWNRFSFLTQNICMNVFLFYFAKWIWGSVMFDKVRLAPLFCYKKASLVKLFHIISHKEDKNNYFFH